MAYDVNGTQINTAYDVSGEIAQNLYDVQGNPLQPPSPVALKVMTYNVGQWYNGTATAVPSEYYDLYYGLQRQIFADNDVDIVGIQEYNDPFSTGHTVESVIGEYFTDSVSYGAAGGAMAYQKKAVFTNGYAISNYEVVNFTDSIWCYIKCKITAGGKDIWLFDTHLATSSTEEAKIAQAEELFNAVSDIEYFIIMGDFNTVCKSVNDAEYTSIMKQYVDAGYRIANCSEQFGFIDTWTNGKTLTDDVWYPCDHIITSSNMVMRDVYRDASKISALNGNHKLDHLPMICTLDIY